MAARARRAASSCGCPWEPPICTRAGTPPAALRGPCSAAQGRRWSCRSASAFARAWSSADSGNSSPCPTRPSRTGERRTPLREPTGFSNVVSAFADYYPSPRRGLHVGGSAGVLAASNFDRSCCLSTYWGGALSVRIGYDVFFSRRWSVGALAQLGGLPLLVERGERLGRFERPPADAGPRGYVRPGGQASVGIPGVNHLAYPLCRAPHRPRRRHLVGLRARLAFRSPRPSAVSLLCVARCTWAAALYRLLRQTNMQRGQR